MRKLASEGLAVVVLGIAMVTAVALELIASWAVLDGMVRAYVPAYSVSPHCCTKVLSCISNEGTN
jgi:hypothetical protein